MQIYFKQNLAFLAVPKTASTSIEIALRRRADIVFAKSRKHVTAGQFHNKVAPFLELFGKVHPERMAIMRDPLDQIRSWYKYRHNPEKSGTPRSTAHVRFDDFVRATLKQRPPVYAEIGSQYRFLTLSDGTVPIHHLFAFENMPQVIGFLEQRFEMELTLPKRNSSPRVDTYLSPEVEQELRYARAQDFALYDRLRDAGGYLQPFSG